MVRKLTDTLAWAGDGAAHLRGLMTRMGDDAFAAPSGLPGWSRAHVLTHVARNADAMINLLTWARTGVPTPAYASDQQREADIEAGAQRRPAEVRADVIGSSDRLAQVVREMPGRAWAARVSNRHGTKILATDIPWSRAREMWIHAVDLDVGASFTDIPPPMLAELIDDVVGGLSSRPNCPTLRLIATDQQRGWTLGEVGGGGGDVDEVRGPAAGLVAWLVGRSRGRDLRTVDGARPPAPPRWL
jgi:maleylpyruvate isomerase